MARPTESFDTFIPPAALVKPVAAPPPLPSNIDQSQRSGERNLAPVLGSVTDWFSAPRTEPLGKNFAPVAAAYGRGGSQDFSAYDVQIPTAELTQHMTMDDQSSGAVQKSLYDKFAGENFADQRTGERSRVTPVVNPEAARMMPRPDSQFVRAPGLERAGLENGDTAKALNFPSFVSKGALGEAGITGNEQERQRFDDLVNEIATSSGRSATDPAVQLEAGNKLWEDRTRGLEGPGGANPIKGAAELLTDPTNLIGGAAAGMAVGFAKKAGIKGAEKVLGDLTKAEISRLAKELPGASAALTAAAKSGDTAAIDAAIAHLRDLKIPESVIASSMKQAGRAEQSAAAVAARAAGKSKEEIADAARAAKVKPGAATNEALATAKGAEFVPNTGAALKRDPVMEAKLAQPTIGQLTPEQIAEAKAPLPGATVPPPTAQVGVQNTTAPVGPQGLTPQGTATVTGRGVKAAKVPNQGTGGGLAARIAKGPPTANPRGGVTIGPPAQGWNPPNMGQAGMNLGGAAGAGGGAYAGKNTMMGTADKNILSKLEGAANAVSAPKSALSTGDVSLSGRQFFAFALSHPKRWAEGLGKGIAAYKDPTGAMNEADRIAKSVGDTLESYGLRRDELEIPTRGSGGLGSSTNFAANPWVARGKYNPLKYIVERGEAAASITAAHIRGSVFDDAVSNRAQHTLEGMGYKTTKDTAVKDLRQVMNGGTFAAITQTRKDMAALGYGKALGQDQVKELARTLNHASGRGYTMPEGSVLARVANLAGNVALFSPQNNVARVRFFADVAGAGKTVAADIARGRPLDPVDLEKMRLGVGYAAGVVGLLSAGSAMGLNVNLDMTSTEFLKIDLGEPGAEKALPAALISSIGLGVQTYEVNGKQRVMLDVTGGAGSLIRTITREAILLPAVLTGDLASLKGTNLAGKTPGGELGQYARNKAAPVVGNTFDILANKNQISNPDLLTGNPITSLFVFLSLQDAIQAGGFNQGGGNTPQKQSPNRPRAGGYPGG